MTATTPRQTATNNELIRKVRRVMNEPIGKEFARLYNAEGQTAAIAFLSRQFGDPDKVLETIDRTYDALVRVNGVKWSE